MVVRPTLGASLEEQREIVHKGLAGGEPQEPRTPDKIKEDGRRRLAALRAGPKR